MTNMYIAGVGLLCAVIVLWFVHWIFTASAALLASLALG